MTDSHPVWHALAPPEVAPALGSGPQGLATEEVERRREIYGPNQIAESKPPSDLVILAHQFTSPLIYILLVAAVVTVLIEEYIDTGVIVAVLVLNAVIGFVQERQAERSVHALMGLVAPRARVLRDGQQSEVESRDLVPGDLVLLETGQRVPADLRLVFAVELKIDESLLTGESVPSRKNTEPVEEKSALGDRYGIAYTGSVVTGGRGRGYVVATGTSTELGRIAESVRSEKPHATPLQKRMTRFSYVIAAAVLVSCLATVVIGTVIGLDLQEIFLVAVALAVAAVPEGLPVVFTITLALGVRRMARRRAIVRRLPAVETLGSTTVIGSDKTGTLTENRMTVREIRSGGVTAEPKPAALAGALGPHPPEPLRLTLIAGVLANEATLSQTDEGRVQAQGDPTEVALLIAAERLGLELADVRAQYEHVRDIPFESERRYSAAVRRTQEQTLTFVKGAPERVVEMCSSVLGPDGPEPLDRAQLARDAADMAAHGLRVLAMAYGEGDLGQGEHEPSGLTLLGVQGMLDPPREGVAEAIEGCRQAGMRVVMITGDHAATARSIGQSLGIVRDEDARVLTGLELDQLSDEQLEREVARTEIYARVSPEHKLRIVRALQRHREVVAVTGDGVNDAPALKAAEIGIAMGRSGTDVAREASDMVLADDNFVSIYAAVEEGRITFDNLRKVTFFLVSTGAATITAILAALTLGWPLPLLPAQLLWLNLVTNGLQDVALAFEPGESGILRRPPRPAREGVISRLLWKRTALVGLVMAAGTLLVFRWELDRTDSLAMAQTAALTTMVIFMAFHAGNARSERRSLLRMSPFSNRFLFVAVIGAFLLHVAAIYFPPTQFILRLEPIEPETWLLMFVVAASIVVAVEAHKLWGRRHGADE